LRRRLFILLATAIAVALALPAVAGAVSPNEVALKKALLKRGVISKFASPALAELSYQAYLAGKARGKSNDQGNPLAARTLKAKAEAGAPGLAGAAQAAAGRVPDDNVLVLLVEFAGEDSGNVGPLHNAMPDPKLTDPTDNTSYWVPDFSPQHYRELLFGAAGKSFTGYFLEQSGGTYMPSGEVTAQWVQLPHSEWYYGADKEYGDDNLNGPVWRVVQDAVAAAGDSIDWAKYDVSPKDGFVDHIMIIHAGAGQEGGGGAQGDSSIWSHSWWVDYGNGGPGGLGGVQTSNPDVYVGPYTIEPEDGTVGVFVHEFTHDLGAPDLYDTEYTGEASTGFWTCMASGSWLGDAGQPLGTSPSGLDIWTKWLLGWAKPTVVKAGDRARTVSLSQASASGADGKAIKVDLPDEPYTTALSAPHSGSTMWWSGMGDNLENTLTKQYSLSTGSPKLSFWTWFDIEAGYDYGYVEVRPAGSTTWTSVAGNLTTAVDSSYGLTGASGTKWLSATYDLSAWSGKTVDIRFRYLTDGGLALKGWAIDDISVDGSAVDTVETSDNGWIASPATGGWARTGNPVARTAKRFYLAEWRQSVGFDSSMRNWYNFVPGGVGNTAQFVSAAPGMLVWYANTRFIDNWVGVHPWQGRLLLVDARPKLASVPYKNGPMDPKSLPLRTRLQLWDAAFSTTVPDPISVTSFGYTQTLTDAAAMPKFDDAAKWYDDSYQRYFGYNRWGATMTNAIDSVKTPTCGLKMTVQAGDANSARVLVDYSRPVR
jgi:immune inhibitor A